MENPIKEIISVDHIRWESMRCGVMPRGYAALAFRVKGDARFTYGGRAAVAHTGDVIYLPQGMGYFAEYSDTEIIVIHFTTASQDSEVDVYSAENGEKIFKCFTEALHIWQGKSAGYRQFAASVLYRILGMLYSEKQKSDLPDNFIRAVSYMNSNYRRHDLSVRDLCRKSKISESHFRELFARHYKKTPVAYISELRIDCARNLISGGMSIEEAAFASGFNDPKYFARVVKKYLSCTPKALKMYGK